MFWVLFFCVFSTIRIFSRIRAKPSLFVTSDSSNFRDYFSYNRFELISNEGPVEHTSSSIVSHSGLLKVFADFIVLSKCEFVILSPETFGLSAALAGRSEIYHVSDNNDGNACKKVVCSHNSRYCSFSWSGTGVVTSRNEHRTHLEISQSWDPYLAEANSKGKNIIGSKILLNKKKEPHVDGISQNFHDSLSHKYILQG